MAFRLGIFGRLLEAIKASTWCSCGCPPDISGSFLLLALRYYQHLTEEVKGASWVLFSGSCPLSVLALLASDLI
jgi:hypothetical protein